MRRTLLTVAILIACKDRRPEQPPPAPLPHDGVTLIQPGAAPLQVLRYHLTKGATTTSEVVYDFDARSEDRAAIPPSAQGEGPGTGSGQPSAAAAAQATAPSSSEGGPAPTLIVTLETAVEDVLPDGTAKLRVTVVKTRVRDQPGNLPAGDVLRGQAAAADGVVFTETLSPDGKVSGARVEAAANLPAKVRERLDGLIQGLEQVAMQLPSEPIGIGATWRERKPLPAGGIRAMTETTYALTSLTGTTASYTGTGRSTGDAQIVEQDGMKVAVTNPRGHSETKGTLDLAQYTAEVTSKSSFTAEMNVDAPAGTPGAGSSMIEVTVGIQMMPARAAGTEEPAAGSAAGPAPAAAQSSPGAHLEADQGAHSAP
jgi:hypothetical protein